MMNVCSAKPNVEPGREQLREAVVGLQRDLHPARDEEHEDEQQRGDADQAELLRERGVDEVGVHERDQLLPPSGVVNVPLPSPAPPKPPFAIEYSDLHELVALAVLSQREPAGRRAEDLVDRPRMQPDHDALVDVADLLVGDVAAGDEEPEPDEHERQARRRDVEHREEDPEVEEARAEVVRHDEHEHARAPDHEQRADVLQPSLREHLALLAQVRGEEDDQEDLRELAGLELERADAHPEPRAVDGRPEPGQPRQEEQHDRADPEEVLVRLEHAVVAAQAEERQREERDADHDPEALLERVARAEAVDLGQRRPPSAARPSAAGTGRRSARSRRATRCAAR